jgi:hypothetical protein
VAALVMSLVYAVRLNANYFRSEVTPLVSVDFLSFLLLWFSLLGTGPAVLAEWFLMQGWGFIGLEDWRYGACWMSVLRAG